LAQLIIYQLTASAVLDRTVAENICMVVHDGYATIVPYRSVFTDASQIRQVRALHYITLH